ncbi:1,4-dihydroxy-2-naphthoate octaprenyltransferase [Lentibacillus kapialis]|uniref:1,4-dihydroxy-2-naphthoate octaprenyltransferase n=1 Tax=Lentibacillus kapialis TaxID=340214 RepID=A0A917UZJ4_9BACI|nr:prenyltransferase [Lentibacillus kapialis]GGK03458.1 1,4-dihydroxy-2-naphthoate octaprenyltransferase [Lentibacillus kapialis]
MLQSSIHHSHETYYYRASWIQLLRPMTLTGTITPVLAGTGMASIHGGIRFDIFFAMLTAALLIQSATNLFNDYYDFLHGQDREKWTVDVSEAKGPAHQRVSYLAGLMIFIACIIGVWLAFQSTLWIIPAGMTGIIFGYLYSAGPRPLCSIGLGETVAFTFLGPVVTIVGYIVQGHAVTFQIVILSLPFALIIASMILTNNIRDIKKDIAFRNTLATIIGRNRAVHLLTVMLSSAYLIVLALAAAGSIPSSAVIVLLALPIAFRLHWSFRKNATRSEELSGMKWAAWHHWTFGLLLALSLWL